MPLSPHERGSRNIGDYLYSIDPSGQDDFGYIWGGWNQRPDSIFDLTGSGQLASGGPFIDNAKIYVRTARVVAQRHPIWLTGPGYDIFGGGIALSGVAGHSVFKDGTPVINWQDTNKSKWPMAPIDLRYDRYRSVWTAPYNAFPVQVKQIASSGTAYDHNGNLLQGTPWNYYSPASGHYRYLVEPFPFTTPEEQLADYPPTPMINTFEKNGDINFLTELNIVTAYINPNRAVSGTLMCAEHPVRYCAFI